MDVVYAKANTQVHRNGVPVMVIVGQHWPASDPVVQQYPSLFTADPRVGMMATEIPPEDPTAEGGKVRGGSVEQVTAAPGETRTGTRRGS